MRSPRLLVTVLAALLLVLVPSAASAAITVTPSSSTVAPGSTVDLTAAAPVAQVGSTTQEITQLIDPAKVRLTGASDITYPAGWSLSYCSGAGTDCTDPANFTAAAPANASVWAAVKAVKATGAVDSQGEDAGRQVAQGAMSGSARSTAPASLNASSGDGFNVFFNADRTHAFNIYHHETSGKLDCWVISTGARCTGFPYQWGGSSGELSVGAVVGSNVWIQGTGLFASSGPGGLYCVDISLVLASSTGSPRACTGGAIAGGKLTLNAGGEFLNFAGATAIGVAGETRLYAADTAASPVKVYCIDTAAKATCGSWTTSLPNTNWTERYGNHVLWGDNLYVVAGNGRTATCIDVTSGSTCPGWSANYVANLWSKFFELPDAAGGVRGVCLYNRSTEADPFPCWRADGTKFQAGQHGFTGTVRSAEQNYGVFTRVGTRVLFGNGSWSGSGSIYCYDALANGGAGGRCNDALTDFSYKNYTATLDPLVENCMWIAQHDSPVIQTVNMLTRELGCSSLGRTRATFSGATAVPRMGCSATSAIAEWDEFTLDTPSTGFTGATLTVKSSSGANIAGWTDIPITVGVAVDLSTLPMTMTGQTPSFVVDFQGASGALNASARIRVIGDAPQLCTRLTAQTICPAVSAGPIPTPSNVAMITVLGDGSVTNDATPPVTTPMGQGSASVAISAPSVAQCSGTVGGRAVDTSPTPRAVAGAVVALYDASGNALTYQAGHPQAGQPVTATTDASGYYTFAGVAPAGYKVHFANAASLTAVDTTVAAGGSGTVTASGGAMTSNASTVAIGGTGTVNARYTIASSTTADTSAGAQGAVQTINPLANDTPLSGGSFTASTARLCVTGTANGSCTGTSLVVPGEGSYSITNGVVTFTPCSAAGTPAGASCTGPFTGPATAVKYVVTDSGSNVVTSTITPTVVPPPSAVNDAQAGAYDTNQTITPLANDAAATGATLTASTVKLCPHPQPAAPYTASNCNQSSVSIANEGTYTANPDGTVTFDPLPSFAGVAQTPVRYVVRDSLSQVASALITPTVAPPAAPTASPDAEVVIPGATATFPAILGGGGLAGGTGLQTGPTNGPCLVDPSDSVCKASFAIAGEGTWTVNRTTGVATFQADANATPGQKTPVTYRVTDAVGQAATSTLTATIPTAPTATADTTTGVVGQPQTRNLIANDTAGSGSSLVASSARLCPVAATAPYTASNCNQTSVTTSDGTYALVAGVVTFTPASGFTGTAAGLHYVVQDGLTQVASSTYTPTVVAIPAPTAQPDTSMGVQGATQDIAPLANDAAGSAQFPLGATTVLLCGPSETPPNCTQTTLALTSEGAYTVDPSTGRVVFQPLPTFTGTATPVTYQVTDAANQTTSSTITPTVVAPGPPQVAPATVTVTAGETGTLRPAVTPGTAPLNPSASCLAAPGQTGCAPGTLTLTRPEGTYVLDPATGAVTFTPAAGYAGTPSDPPSLCATDQAGQSACGLLTPTVTPAAASASLQGAAVPTALPNVQSTPRNTPVTLSILANDAASMGATLNPASVRLQDPETGKWVKTLAIAGEGMWTVDADGTLTFTPLPGFVGFGTPVVYRVADTTGRRAQSTAKVIVRDTPPPWADPQYQQGVQGQTITFDPLATITAQGSPLDPASVRMQDPTTRRWTTRVVIPGQGTWTVDPMTGKVSFKPLASFSGTATPLKYRVADRAGRTVKSTLNPVIRKPGPALDITTTTTRRVLRPGQTATITLRIVNEGLATTSGTETRAPIPAGFVLADARGGTERGGWIRFRTGDLAPGASKVRRFVLRAGDAPTKARAVTGTATSTNTRGVRDPVAVVIIATSGAASSAVTG